MILLAIKQIHPFQLLIVLITCILMQVYVLDATNLLTSVIGSFLITLVLIVLLNLFLLFLSK